MDGKNGVPVGEGSITLTITREVRRGLGPRPTDPIRYLLDGRHGLPPMGGYISLTIIRGPRHGRTPDGGSDVPTIYSLDVIILFDPFIGYSSFHNLGSKLYNLEGCKLTWGRHE